MRMASRSCPLLLALLALLALTAPGASAQYQAQSGWSLPRKVASSAGADGLALAADGALYLVDESGIVVVSPRGGRSTLVAQSGTRDLSASRRGSDLALAWRQTSYLGDDVLWLWWRGSTRKAVVGQKGEFLVLAGPRGPTLVYASDRDGNSVISARSWDGGSRDLYTTPLTTKALTAAIDDSGRITLLFAEGYRHEFENGSDERYDTILVSGGRRRVVGPAVLPRYGSRYLLVPAAGGLAPVWWWETPEAQQRARRNGFHQPQLAALSAGRLRVLADDVPYAAALFGSAGDEVFWFEDDRVRSVTIGGGQPRPVLRARDNIVAAFLAPGPSIAYQSLQRDAITADAFLSDRSHPYSPSLLDRLSVSLGWNPWYPAETAFSSLLVAVLGGIIAASLVAPLVWFPLVLTGLIRRRGLILGAAVAWLAVLVTRYLTGQAAARPDLRSWELAALLEPAWWLVLAGLVFGSLVARLLWRRAASSDFGPVIVAGVIAFFTAAVSVFSRVGFVHF